MPSPSNPLPWPKIDPKQSFPALERDVLAFWNDAKIFEQSVEREPQKGEFKFYDGPPFATGLPHYGHILQSVIKDVIPRYKTMTGYRVPRRWGWDCHGLPVENLIEKELGLADKRAIESFGEDTFNEACRASVMRFADEWKRFIPRMGRWVDMEHDYKTMNPEFMESVWWVFGELWKKGLIYEGLKPMQVCPRCVTPLANFEVGQGYKDVTDLSCIAKFKVVGEENTYFLAWTTTPWTLPGNVALAVNPEVEYVKIMAEKEDILIEPQPLSPMVDRTIDDINPKDFKMAAGITASNSADFGDSKLFEKKLKEGGLLLKKGECYWIASKRLPLTIAGDGGKPKILETKKGSELIGLSYEPLFPYFANEKTNDAEFEIEEVRDAATFEIVKNLRYEKLLQPFGVPEEFREKFAENHRRAAVAKLDNQIIGFVAFDEKEKSLRIETIFVEPEFRQKGIGQELIEFVESKIGDFPSERIFVEAEIGAISFYEKLGFQKFGEIEKRFSTEIQSMEKFLNQKTRSGKPFRVVAADFVTTADGTGIVHIAPAFGEDDLNVGKKEKLPTIQHVTMEGKFISAVTDFAGLDVKPKDDPRKTDKKVIDWLEAHGKLFKSENFKHSYPHCWRCDTPLLNYATSSWFVAVEKIKNDLLANNEKVNWIPEHVKAGRFGKWLEGARDWAISRNRYWGAPLPVWKCDMTGETVCVSSVDELEKLSGTRVADLHKHFVDEITWPNAKAADKAVEITFVRHGQTDWNIQPIRIQGTTDNALNDAGKKQADELRATLKMDDYDVIISSPLLRARQTAEIIANGREVIVDELIAEKNFGQLEGKTYAEVFAAFPQFKTTNDIRWQVAPPGGEAHTEVLARMRRFLVRLRRDYPGKRVLVIAHGVMTRYFRYVFEHDEELLGTEMHNCCAYTHRSVPTFHRIPEVLDCWFESGSMPYAQDATKAKTILPADFIAEAQDQTRGWFYTLHVLATALQNKPAFANVVCSGLVLAEDGQKMSKSKKNYPDPNEVIEKYGADAMRLYLLNSPVVRGEALRFSERGVEETLRGVLLPLWNTYYFFTTYATADGWTPTNDKLETHNSLDRWILSELNILIRDMTGALERYELNDAVRPLTAFLDGLTNWYIRRSRRRFWKSESDVDKKEAYATLLHVLTTVTQLLAPFCPFTAEAIYRGLKAPLFEKEGLGEISVHLADWPTVDEKRIDENLSAEIAIVRKIISAGLAIRGREKLKVRQPLASATVALPTSPLFEKEGLGEISGELATISEELNVKTITFAKNPEDIAETIVTVNARALGPRLGGKVQEVIKRAKAGEFEITNDGVKVGDELLTGDEVSVGYRGKAGLAVESIDGIVVALDTTITPELELEGRARDLVRVIQDLRKDADYNVSDRIIVAIKNADDILADAELKNYIATETLATEIVAELPNADKTTEVEGVIVAVKRA